MKPPCARVKNETTENVLQNLNDLKIYTTKIEQNYSQFAENLNLLNPKLASQKTSFEIIEKQIIELKDELKINQNKIEKALLKYEIEDVDKIQLVLNQQLDLPIVRKELEDFRVLFETLKSSIIELDQKLTEVSFDEKIYQSQEEKLFFVTNQLKEANEIVTKTTTEIERMNK